MNARAHGQRRHRREQDRVAVGCGARRRLRRDDGAAARTILHHDRPLELVLQLLRQDARENVGAAAGGERTEKRHRALGIAVSRRLRGRSVEGEAAGEREHDGSFHALSGGGNGSAPSRDGGRRAPAMLPPRKHGKRAHLCGSREFRCYLAPHLPSPARYATFPRNHPDGGVVLAPLARRLGC